jgi:asparagine synthase (glutamine-hydrolysing)
MCGICGIATGGAPVEPERLAAMAAMLVHRGPDSDGAHLDGPVGIAARRLSIIDLETGDQPVATEDGSVVTVQNGEIYNYEELRRELERQGHTFRTHGDTEVIAHLYEQHGLAFAPLLRGMFAVATTGRQAVSSSSRPSCVRCRAARSTATRWRRSSHSTPSPRR